MDILFEDNDIIVCIKPVGILSQESMQENMVSVLRSITQNEIYPVHRLDKGVGGVMVYAKNKQSAASLSKQIEEHSFEKEYDAVISGKMDEQSGVLEDLLFKDSTKNKTYVVKRMRKGVKKAKLMYNTIAVCETDEGTLSLIHVKLFTGRSHQIRVQFASRNHPLIGDRRYGSKIAYQKLALFSCFVSFKHPKTNEKMSFSAKDEDMLKMFKLYKN